MQIYLWNKSGGPSKKLLNNMTKMENHNIYDYFYYICIRTI